MIIFLEKEWASITGTCSMQEEDTNADNVLTKNC